MTALKPAGDGAYAAEGALAAAGAAQCVFFDCDGVLVDVSKSYDEAIRETVDVLLTRFAGLEENPVPVTAEIIEAFKASGGFNDEIDLAYAVSLCIAASSGNGGPEYVMRAANAADSSGLSSVEEYLSAKSEAGQLREKLQYPGDGKGIVYDIFDSVFYGQELYSSMGRADAGVYKKSGLIDCDQIIMDSKLAPSLAYKFGRKPGIVTGRGMQSISHTLGDMMREFDVENSVFLEDEPRKMAKPNPESLVRCMAGMGITRAVFVGDSVEDLLLAQGASESGREVVFCGIIGTSRVPSEKLSLFGEKNAHMAVDSVLRLPALF